MNTPTKRSPGKHFTPLLYATPEQILSSAEVIANNYRENISQTLNRALASPAQQSPLFDIQVGEALEAFIEGSPVQADLALQGCSSVLNPLSSPTVYHYALSQEFPQQISSPAPRSPCVTRRRTELLEADEIENPIVHEDFVRSQITTFVEEVEEQKIPNILMRADGEYCFDAWFCKKLRGIPPGVGFKCAHCVARHAFQIKMLTFLKRIYPDGLINMMDFVSPELIRAADAELYEMLEQQQYNLQKVFSLPQQTHYTEIFDLILKPASSAQEQQNQCSEKFAKALELAEIPDNGPAMPVLFLLSELVFNVPCYVAFFLFPLIRSRYRFLHPNYQSRNETFMEYDELAQNLRIDGTCPDFFKYDGVTLAFDQVLQFYQEFIDHQNSQKRLFNCLKSFKNIAFDSQLKKPLVADCLRAAELELLMHFVCQFHPGLEFLRPTAEFQLLYSQSVAIRIIIQNDFGKHNALNLRQFVRGNLLGELWTLSRTPDLNRMLRYFSYEHFYVIYCQFWQLDSDHDNVITRDEMMHYGAATCPFGHKCVCDGQSCRCGNIYNNLVIESLFNSKTPLHFDDFVQFFIKEENKDLPIAQEYFFDLIDWDGDGYINFNDFWQFYRHMQAIASTHFREIKSAENMYCQLLDCAKHCTGHAAQDGYISLADIRKSRLCGNFFNTVCNYQKLAYFEIKDPYSIKYPVGGCERNYFERYCRMMYDLMEDGDYQESLDGAGLDDI